MAFTASKAEMTLQELAERIQANNKRLEQAARVISDVETDLAAMSTQYTQVIAELNAAASQNPSDAVIQNWKSRKDKLVIEFIELKANAGLMRVSLASVKE